MKNDIDLTNIRNGIDLTNIKNGIDLTNMRIVSTALVWMSDIDITCIIYTVVYFFSNRPKIRYKIHFDISLIRESLPQISL
jgi:hypothetical protein